MDGDTLDWPQPFVYLREPLQRTHRVRFPSAEDPVERRFVVAAATRRERAIERLTQLVPGLDWADLANTTDGATFLVVPSSVDAIDDLRVFDALERVACTVDPAGVINVPGNESHQSSLAGDAVGQFSGTQRHQRLIAGPTAEAIRTGNTIIVNGLERFWEPLQQLSADLVATFACTSNSNCYISAGGSQGFGAHWDDTDVVILQVSGSKYWEIFEPTVLSPLRLNTDDAVGSNVAWSGVLTPGTALFIPRGWGHRVDANGPSVHLTVSMHKHTVSDMLGFLAADSTNWPIMRADLPFDLDRPPRSYAGSVFDDDGAFDRALAPLLPSILERGVAAARASAPPAMAQSFAETLRVSFEGSWATAVVEAPYPTGIMIVEGPDDGGITLAMGGSVVRVDRGLAGIVSAALAGPIAVDDLRDHAPYLDDEALDLVVAGMVRAGVLHVVSGGA